jgi:hypothetical protein
MLDPDYNASVEDIYTKTAAYLLKLHNCIFILHNAGIDLPRKYKDLPSWVPQWGILFRRGSYLVCALDEPGYRAAGGSVSSLYFKGRDILAIMDILIDAVENVSSKRVKRPSHIDSTREDYKWTNIYSIDSWFRELDTVIETLRCNSGDFLDLYPSRKDTWDEAYWRTLIANNAIPGPRPAPATYGDLFKMCRRLVESIVAGLSTDPKHFLRTLMDINAITRLAARTDGVMLKRF